jgi:hypothetical protein
MDEAAPTTEALYGSWLQMHDARLREFEREMTATRVLAVVTLFAMVVLASAVIVRRAPKGGNQP